MKQHITKEQLNQLSDKAKTRLLKWWTPESWDGLSSGHVITSHIFSSGSFMVCAGVANPEEWDKKLLDESKIYPLLSIGQMIEFLYDHRSPKKEEHIHFSQEEYFWDEWWCLVPQMLCDDLWNVVKDILEEHA